MRPVPLCLVATLAVLAGGCGERAVVQAPVSIPNDLTGSWNEADAAHPGFVSFGQRSVTIALQGSARLSAVPESCTAEPGVGAGEIGLPGGIRLFVASGSEPRERRVGDLRFVENARWLDLTLESPGQPAIQRRLWAAQSGQLAMTMLPVPAAIPPAQAAAPVAAKADPDEVFAVATPARKADALALIGLRSSGADRTALASSFSDRQCDAWKQELAELAGAKDDPAGAAGHLATASRLHRDAIAFHDAVQSWLAVRE